MIWFAIIAIFSSFLAPHNAQPPVDDFPAIPLCDDSEIDSIFNSEDGGIYAIRGPHYWKLLDRKIVEGPKLVKDKWKDVPDDLDAAFYNGALYYFFKGSKVWIYFWDKHLHSYKIYEKDKFPKEISQVFPGIPNELDAAMGWSETQTFFFKGSSYWKFDIEAHPPVANIYPQNISIWEGVPNNLDAALRITDLRNFPKVTYFFKGDKYYTFDDFDFQVQTGDPPYPRPTAVYWFGCENEDLKRPFEDRPKDIQDKNLCDSPNIDTIFTTESGETYVFKGENYWKLSSTGIEKGYPQKITSKWKGLPKELSRDFDSVFLDSKEANTHFFKGTIYWRSSFGDKQGTWNGSTEISDNFPGIPDFIDEAMEWGANRKYYFFKGNKYWTFDPSKEPHVGSEYPKKIIDWEGLPDSIDAAFTYTNGYTYFFKNDKFYKFDDKAFKVLDEDPPFPHLSAKSWFGCKGDLKPFKPAKEKTLPQIDAEDKSLCDPLKPIDTVLTIPEKYNPDVAYVIKGSWYWRLTGTSIALDYPKRMNWRWKELPLPIDAAYSEIPANSSTYTTYFFKEDKVWKYKGNKDTGNITLESGFPKLINDEFYGIPDNLDDVITWGSTTDIIYFFKGALYWVYDRTKDPKVDGKYPKPISDFKGIRTNVDAVLSYKTTNYTYFFKSGKFQKFDNVKFEVHYATVYPQPNGLWWFGCG